MSLIFKQIAVESSNLAIGMYVAKLDRPWLETPFVFQGFEIRDNHEIEQLQSYCQFVYVDADRGKFDEVKLRSLVASAKTRAISAGVRTNDARRQSSQPSRFVTFLSRIGLKRLVAERRGTDDRRKSRVTVRSEAPLANEAYDILRAQHKTVLEQASRDGLVDIAGVIEAATPTIESVLRNPDAIVWAIFSKKETGRNYSRAVATSVWAVMLGRHLGFDEDALRDLAVGGLLLDVGNVNLSEDILKTEGEITTEQFDHVSRHVVLGLEILRASRGVRQNVLDMVKCHHERSDGSGYPEGLRGNTIPIYGRIAGIVDCYDAMTTRTSYSPAMGAYEAARQMNDMRGEQFQVEVVEQFLRTIGMFPTGSVVELSDGTVGVVLEQNTSNALLPKVMLLVDADGQPFEQRRILDMRNVGEEALGQKAMWIKKGHEHGAFGIDPSEHFS